MVLLCLLLPSESRRIEMENWYALRHEFMDCYHTMPLHKCHAVEDIWTNSTLMPHLKRNTDKKYLIFAFILSILPSVPVLEFKTFYRKSYVGLVCDSWNELCIYQAGIHI